VLVLVALGVWYAADVGPGFALTSSDDFAYASATVDLDQGASLVHHFDSPAFSSPYNPIDGKPGEYASKYPLGVSFLLVPFYLVGGFRALFALGPLMAVLGVAALYDLTLQLTRRRPVALVAAALLALLPPIAAQASVVGSDLPSMTFITAALAVYARYLARPRTATLCLFALLAGAAFVVRNPNVLLFAVAGGHQLALHRRRLGGEVKKWAAALACFGVFVALQVGANLLTFGSLVGGYTHEAEGGFTFGNLVRHLPGYLVMLSVVPPLGFVAMVAVAARRRELAFLAALVVAFTLLYSAWWAFQLDAGHAFVSGLRFVVPILPLLCLFVAVAAFDLSGAGARRAFLAVALIAELGASAVLTVQLRQYKGRMAAHRDRIYAATSPRAVVLGPLEWSKLFFPHDGSGRALRYASYEPAIERVGAQEIARIVDVGLARGDAVFALGSGRRQTPAEQRAAAELRARYRLVPVVDETRPYELRVDQVLPR
jgi:hypothetical protein